jgi:hypothetical protein
MKYRWRAGLAFMIFMVAGQALGSGGPPPTPTYVERRGGTAAELALLYAGRPGVVMAGAKAPMLFLEWRLLHRLPVGAEAGAALAPLCCDWPGDNAPKVGVDAWVDARGLVPAGADGPSWVASDRQGPDYTSIPNCFPDAFEKAAATLRDRVTRYSATSPAVIAWLHTQDAVFDACANPTAALPALPADAPAWLTADRAYQEAAFALYNMRNAEAASRFAAIARDRASPWQPLGLYLGVRAMQREALGHPTPDNFARARAAIATLASAPAGTFGKGEVTGMTRALAYRDQPAALLTELDHELAGRALDHAVAFSVTDYLNLARRAERKPDAADWILTLGAPQEQRAAAGAHARERWSTSHDYAWLIAALGFTDPGDPAAAALVADAGRVAPADPAWLSAQYQAIRLTISSADPAAMRARLDALLARTDLSLTEHNLFAAARTQVATDLGEFARLALRRPYCPLTTNGVCRPDSWETINELMAPAPGGAPYWVGFGPDARAIIDRLPLPERIALSHDATLPAQLRLDLALTSFARAVQLQDVGAIEQLARDLALALPQMGADFRAILATPPGPDQRFAEFFVMAKIPGLRADLFDYTRPTGTVAQFQGQWVDWLIAPRGAVSATPPNFPRPAQYLEGGWYAGEEGTGDLVCENLCGGGAFPLHLPPFAAALQPRAAAERAAFLTTPNPDLNIGPNGEPLPTAPPPPGTISIWNEALAWAEAHPRDPRSPETCYWLIHIARWGANHDHLGRRAFRVLRARWPASDWARRSPYFYDD